LILPTCTALPGAVDAADAAEIGRAEPGRAAAAVAVDAEVFHCFSERREEAEEEEEEEEEEE